jgi:hypothetical protein
MSKISYIWLVGILSFTSPVVFAATVIPDAELDTITGQTGIVLNVVLDMLIGEDYNLLSDEEKSNVRQMLDKTFGPLTQTEVEQIISSHQLFVDMLQQLPEADRHKIEEAYEIITAQMKATAPADLLGMTAGGELTADNLGDWASDKVNKILIAQQIINDMINALSPDQYQQMSIVQDIFNKHIDTLKE